MAQKTYGMNMKRMHRLLVVAERINPREFDMAFWFVAAAKPGTDVGVRVCELTGSRNSADFASLKKVNGRLPNGTLCKTKACLAGWAGVDPVLHREGLSLMLRTTMFGGLNGGIAFGRLRENSALKSFFGLNAGAIIKLFGWDGGDTRKLHGASGKRQMIRHIKDAIAHPERYGADGEWMAD